ncbi:MAG: pentapeptide repeat-containing protein [Myxococcales bacterium]|nr:pentapeptide repeat-containing protein [Myxococcales bacterium]
MKTKKRESLWRVTIGPKLRDHLEWYYRQGRTGTGRLVIADEDIQGADLRSVQGARFERVDFSGAGVQMLDDLEAIDCGFDEALLQGSTWRRAKLEKCRFRGATAYGANFEDARIDDCDWLGAWLEHSVWTRATVSRVSFVAATLVDSRFDGATFVDCDFSRADLSRGEFSMDSARCPGTRFERCDFRNANIDGLRFNNTTFDHCRFGSVRGKPDLEGSCTLIAPDFSNGIAEWESVSGVPGLRDPDEVLRVWREHDAAYLRHWNLFADDAGYEPHRHYPERLKPGV